MTDEEITARVKEFESLCDLIPEDAYWGMPLTPNLVRHIRASIDNAKAVDPETFPNEGRCAARAAGESCNCPEVCLRWIANPTPVPPIALAGEPVAHDLLATLIDVYDDGQNEFDARCYVQGTWKQVLAEARAYLAAPTPSASSVPVAISEISSKNVDAACSRVVDEEFFALIDAAPPASPAPSDLTNEHEAFEAMLQREDYGSNAATRQGDGYKYSTIDDMWRGWQARSALLQANGAKHV